MELNTDAMKNKENKHLPFDLLSTVEHGGCSAKLSMSQLAEVLHDFPQIKHPNLLVGTETHDDAGVYKLNDDLAIIQTVDFFPPICSNAFEFGQIAAANALSDIYAMGGTALTALNIVMFPSRRIPLEVLRDILKGGMEKVQEAGAIIIGGHTIDDYPPKYGLAVTGTIHPDNIITNASAEPGESVILTKPIGTGVLTAGKRINIAGDEDYINALENMKLLNKNGGAIMQKHGVRCATDVTGFSLLGHGLKLALAGDVSLRLDSKKVPLLKGAYELVKMGCIPGAAFRNLDFIEKDSVFMPNVDYNLKMLMLDAQTSGGLLMTVNPVKAELVLNDLHEAGYHFATIIGGIISKTNASVIVS